MMPKETIENPELSIESRTFDIIRPSNYAENGYPYAEWKLLREQAPIYYWDRTVQNPFYAVTRYDDVVWISKQPKLFQNGPRIAVILGSDPGTETPREGNPPAVSYTHLRAHATLR